MRKLEIKSFTCSSNRKVLMIFPLVRDEEIQILAFGIPPWLILTGGTTKQQSHTLPGARKNEYQNNLGSLRFPKIEQTIS